MPIRRSWSCWILPWVQRPIILRTIAPDVTPFSPDLHEDGFLRARAHSTGHAVPVAAGPPRWNRHRADHRLFGRADRSVAAGSGVAERRRHIRDPANGLRLGRSCDTTPANRATGEAELHLR